MSPSQRNFCSSFAPPSADQSANAHQTKLAPFRTRSSFQRVVISEILLQCVNVHCSTDRHVFYLPYPFGLTSAIYIPERHVARLLCRRLWSSSCAAGVVPVEYSCASTD